MPAKRNPKKSRKQSSPQVTPPKLDALTVTPPAVVLPTEPVASAVPPDTVPPSESLETPVLPGASATPPRSGPPAGRQARITGRSQRAGQTRFYAFRRS
ncbi:MULTISPECIES: hypothetical protein [Micromonospora]|uniref:hypothetical protein n=1 Tax=Micromonospora TaxID=1873 RepID=UPI0001C4585D|nr:MULTISPECIES: hypothetical protein [Micromonospora]ADU08979.1 hypothetical protein ML5_3465 [Micromonospora sp. L5]SCL42337.1 hypothetical protein GA0070615_5485 [Micromonospora aurantiaca]